MVVLNGKARRVSNANGINSCQRSIERILWHYRRNSIGKKSTLNATHTLIVNPVSNAEEHPSITKDHPLIRSFATPQPLIALRRVNERVLSEVAHPMYRRARPCFSYVSFFCTLLLRNSPFQRRVTLMHPALKQ